MNMGGDNGSARYAENVPSGHLLLRMASCGCSLHWNEATVLARHCERNAKKVTEAHLTNNVGHCTCAGGTSFSLGHKRDAVSQLSFPHISHIIMGEKVL